MANFVFSSPTRILFSRILLQLFPKERDEKERGGDLDAKEVYYA
jgi:hypothetical protein